MKVSLKLVSEKLHFCFAGADAARKRERLPKSEVKRRKRLRKLSKSV